MRFRFTLCLLLCSLSMERWSFLLNLLVVVVVAFSVWRYVWHFKMCVFSTFSTKNHMLEIYVQLSIGHQLHSVCLVFCFDTFKTNKRTRRKTTSIDIQTEISNFLHHNYYLLEQGKNCRNDEIQTSNKYHRKYIYISFLECNITSNNCHSIDMKIQFEDLQYVIFFLYLT